MLKASVIIFRPELRFWASDTTYINHAKATENNIRLIVIVVAFWPWSFTRLETVIGHL